MTSENVPRFDPEARFARRLRHLRTARAMKQSDVAEHMVMRGHTGWRQTMVARLEAGERALRVNEAVDLAAILEVPLAEMLNPDADAAATPLEEAQAKLFAARMRQEQVRVRLHLAQRDAEAASEKAALIREQYIDASRKVAMLHAWVKAQLPRTRDAEDAADYAQRLAVEMRNITTGSYVMETAVRAPADVDVVQVHVDPDGVVPPGPPEPPAPA